MNPIQFSEKLNAIVPSTHGEHMQELWQLIDHAGELECDITVAEHVFKYLEKYPDDDFGSPGPLVHYVEAAYPNYVDALLESIHRRPVSLTIWMINRILNSNIEVSLKLRLIGALKTISQNPLISVEEREQAIEFLSLH